MSDVLNCPLCGSEVTRRAPLNYRCPNCRIGGDPLAFSEIAKIMRERDRFKRLVVRDEDGCIVSQGAFNSLAGRVKHLERELETCKRQRDNAVTDMEFILSQRPIR